MTNAIKPITIQNATPPGRTQQLQNEMIANGTTSEEKKCGTHWSPCSETSKSLKVKQREWRVSLKQQVTRNKDIVTYWEGNVEEWGELFGTDQRPSRREDAWTIIHVIWDRTCSCTGHVVGRKERKARKGLPIIPTPNQINFLTQLESYPHVVAQVGAHSAIGDCNGSRDSSQDDGHTWRKGPDHMWLSWW